MKKLNKIVSFLVVFILPLITNMSIVDAKPLKYGDLDESGEVNGIDLTYAKSAFKGKYELKPIQIALADVGDQNGTYDGIDYTILNLAYNDFQYVLNNRMTGKDNLSVLLGGYDKPLYKPECQALFGTIEKCIAGYEFSNSENGVYTSTNTIGNKATYYFRGNNVNNYVQMGTYKNDVKVENSTLAKAGDPILWRILRKNENNSIRLISELPVVNNVKFNLSNSSTYPRSKLETALKNWYNTNIASDSNVKDYVVDSTFCNDISGTAPTRESTNTPTFACPDGFFNDKIGTITMDEMLFAGNKISTSYEGFLDDGYSFWTLTAKDANMVYSFYSETSNLINQNANINNVGGRAVISLSETTEIKKDGDGTKDNPYVIGEPFEDLPVIMNTENQDTENIVSSTIISNAKKNNKTLTYKIYNTAKDGGDGKFLYSWSIDPSSIDSTFSNLNTVIEKNKIESSSPEDYYIIQRILNGAKGTVLTIKPDNSSTFDVSTYIGDVLPSASKVWMYEWDSGKRTLKPFAENVSVVDNIINFKFRGTSLEKNILVTSAALPDNVINNPQTGMTIFYIMGGIVLLMVAGFGYLIYMKNNNRFPNI